MSAAMNALPTDIFLKQYNISWLFFDQPSSTHAMPAAAMQC